MNKLTQLEAGFLRDINPYLLPEANRQEIVNLLRGAILASQNNFRGDVTWTDDQLY
jgi:hypothetical protein